MSLLVSTSECMVMLVTRVFAVIVVPVRPLSTSPIFSLLLTFSAVLGKVTFYSTIATL